MPDALRRALVEPARREGYHFEDDALVGEMVEAVEGVKGGLPLLAFAVARLWEERDREKKRLTREAYERIEGVAGALAQHAEATLSQLEPEREGMVREIFRNLVTAQGTRAAPDRAELASVFGERRDEAGAVLDALVDARLLTEYEAGPTHSGQGPTAATNGESPTAAGDEAGHRVEIVHESLLTHWPRLARGGRRTWTGPSSATSSGRRRTCGTSADDRTTSCGRGPRTWTTTRGAPATPAGCPRSNRISRRP